MNIIGPSEDNECCCCMTNNVILHEFESEFGDNIKTHQHCDYCYETLAGNACQYPGQYDFTMIRILMAGLNILEKKLKNV